MSAVNCQHRIIRTSGVHGCKLGMFGGNPIDRTCLRVCTVADKVVRESTPEEMEAERLAKEKSPCAGCGDKTNIAEVMASVEAQERLLRGE